MRAAVVVITYEDLKKALRVSSPSVVTVIAIAPQSPEDIVDGRLRVVVQGDDLHKHSPGEWLYVMRNEEQ